MSRSIWVGASFTLTVWAAPPTCEFGIDGKAVVHIEHDVVGFEVAEALDFDRDLVMADGEIRSDIIAAGVAFGGANDGIAIGIRDFNGGAGDRGAGRIIDNAADIAGDLLREDHRGAGTQEYESAEHESYSFHSGPP